MWVWKEYGPHRPLLNGHGGVGPGLCTGGCWQLRVLSGCTGRALRGVGFYQTEGIGFLQGADISHVGLGKRVSCTPEVDGSQRGRSKLGGRPGTMPTREVAADSEEDVERPGSVCDVLIGKFRVLTCSSRRGVTN